MSERINEIDISEIKEKLELQKSTSEEYRTRVRHTIGIWTGAVVGMLASCVAAFVVLLSSFTESSLLSVYGAVAGVAFLVFGLILNSYTKRESNFLCSVKRRPLGYLIRATLSRDELILFSVSCGLSVIGAIVSFVLFATVDAANAVLVVLGIVLLASLAASVVAFFFSGKARIYIAENAAVFEDIETEFAKKSHLI